MNPAPFSKAGWFEVEITPPLGVYLGGRGMVLSVADAVKAPFLAQVIALEDRRGKRLLLVSLDLILVSSAPALTLQTRLAAVSGALPEAVIVNCSHTHSGPFTHYEEFATTFPRPQNLIDYETWLVERVVTAAAEAVRRLRPATIRRHDGTTSIGINRRLRGPDGKVTMGPNPEGEFAPDLFLLDIAQPETGARCVAFSAACHPVIDYSVSLTLLSPDYPGEARDELKQRLGAAVQAQFFQAACGNVRPRILSDFEAGRFRPSRDGDAHEVGVALAADVEKALATPGRLLDLELASAETWILLRADETVTPELETLARTESAGGLAARYWLTRDPSTWARNRPLSIGLFSLAYDCRIAWFSGEPLAEWQQFLRKTLGDAALTVWGYTGQPALYLPADRHLPEGGYETTTSLFEKITPWPLAPGIDAAVAEGFRRLDSSAQ